MARRSIEEAALSRSRPFKSAQRPYRSATVMQRLSSPSSPSRKPKHNGGLGLIRQQISRMRQKHSHVSWPAASSRCQSRPPRPARSSISRSCSARGSFNGLPVSKSSSGCAPSLHNKASRAPRPLSLMWLSRRSTTRPLSGQMASPRSSLALLSAQSASRRSSSKPWPASCRLRTLGGAEGRFAPVAASSPTGAMQPRSWANRQSSARWSSTAAPPSTSFARLRFSASCCRSAARLAFSSAVKDLSRVEGTAPPLRMPAVLTVSLPASQLPQPPATLWRPFWDRCPCWSHWLPFCQSSVASQGSSWFPLPPAAPGSWLLVAAEAWAVVSQEVSSVQVSGAVSEVCALARGRHWRQTSAPPRPPRPPPPRLPRPLPPPDGTRIAKLYGNALALEAVTWFQYSAERPRSTSLPAAREAKRRSVSRRRCSSRRAFSSGLYSRCRSFCS
mmetsp:Transcript_75261/g.207638  ORF Transcript_75261/g.207638 Transcript_75261/m.207638 type:complete len:445 (-) Transcript_75261:188-1522(-)